MIKTKTTVPIKLFFIPDKQSHSDSRKATRMELSTMACEVMLQAMKQKIMSNIQIGNNGQFNNVEHMGRVLVGTFKATRRSVDFLNVDDVGLPADIMVMILQKKVTMYSVLEIALTAIENIGPDMNIEEALQNTATAIMNTVNEL